MIHSFINEQIKIDPARVGFDIDGVVADTAEAFLRIARDEYGINSLSIEDITAFEVELCLDMDPRVISAIFHRLMVAPIDADLRPMPDSIQVLREFADHAPLTFVTARPDREPIVDWLHNALGPDALTNARIVAMGEHDNKPGYVRDLGLDYFIDDRAETCLQLTRHGISAVVFDQPWNRGRHDLPAVRNWREIRALCLD